MEKVQISSKRDTIPTSDPRRACAISLKLPGTDPIHLDSSITSPGGLTDSCEMLSLDDNHYTLRFIPKESGVYVIGVKHKGIHILGSPFEYTVGRFNDSGFHKVKAFGEGLVNSEVKMQCHFNIYTHEAGAGNLVISCEGPSKAKLDLEERSIPGAIGCGYIVSEPGKYEFRVKWNDNEIPDSPFLVDVTPPKGDAKKVMVQSLKQYGMVVGKAVTFSVKSGGAPGAISGYVSRPNGTNNNLFITEQDKGDYGMRFIPEENGIHRVHIVYNGHDIPGSPFCCGAGKANVDVGLVKVSGSGLREGKTGVANKFIIKTVDSGAALLDMRIEGPSKVAINHVSKDDGYEFSYQPTAPGDYYIYVKYGGPYHVAGSPFKAKIIGSGKASGKKEKSTCQIETCIKTPAKAGGSIKSLNELKSDASKVKCSGNGIKKAFVLKPSIFKVETKDAGSSLLFVGVLGVDGPADVDELHIRKSTRSAFQVSYVIKVRGSYHLVVRWGDDDVPGSPFHIQAL